MTKFGEKFTKPLWDGAPDDWGDGDAARAKIDALLDRHNAVIEALTPDQIEAVDRLIHAALVTVVLEQMGYRLWGEQMLYEVVEREAWSGQHVAPVFGPRRPKGKGEPN
jgi:hypothetical protein